MTTTGAHHRLLRLLFLLAFLLGSVAFVPPCPPPKHSLMTRLFTALHPGTVAPSGLNLDEIAARLKLEITDLDSGVFGLDSKDPKYGIEITKVTMPVKPSLGLGLTEMAHGLGRRDSRGMVLVGSVAHGSNAAVSHKVHVGDMIAWLGHDPDRMTRVEGLDLDETMEAMTDYLNTGATTITLLLKRLVKRATVNVTFNYVDNNKQEKSSTITMLAGANLRREMIRQGLPVYDKETKRFDQPYITGNCAGEGLCGTCLIKVLGGKEHLNVPDHTEKMVLDKWKGATWRLSCRTVVGTDNRDANLKLGITPQKGFHKK